MVQFRNLQGSNPYQGLMQTAQRVSEDVGDAYMQLGQAKFGANMKDEEWKRKKKMMETQQHNQMVGQMIDLGSQAIQYEGMQDDKLYQKNVTALKLQDDAFNATSKSLTPDALSRVMDARSGVINKLDSGEKVKIGEGKGGLYGVKLTQKDFIGKSNKASDINSITKAWQTAGKVAQDRRDVAELQYFKAIGWKQELGTDGKSTYKLEPDTNFTDTDRYDGNMGRNEKWEGENGSPGKNAPLNRLVPGTGNSEKNPALWYTNDEMENRKNDWLDNEGFGHFDESLSAYAKRTAGMTIAEYTDGKVGGQSPTSGASHIAGQKKQMEEEIEIKPEAGPNAGKALPANVAKFLSEDVQADLMGKNGQTQQILAKAEQDKLKAQYKVSDLNEFAKSFAPPEAVAEEKTGRPPQTVTTEEKGGEPPTAGGDPVKESALAIAESIKETWGDVKEGTQEIAGGVINYLEEEGYLKKDSTAVAKESTPKKQPAYEGGFTSPSGPGRGEGRLPAIDEISSIKAENVGKTRVQMVQAKNPNIDKEGFVTASRHSAGAKATSKKNDDGTTTVTWKLPSGEVIGEATSKSFRNAQEDAAFNADKNLAKKEKDKPVGPGKFMIFERNEEGEYVNTGEEAGKELVDDQFKDNAAKDEESFKLAYKTQYTDPAIKETGEAISKTQDAIAQEKENRRVRKEGEQANETKELAELGDQSKQLRRSDALPPQLQKPFEGIKKEPPRLQAGESPSLDSQAAAMKATEDQFQSDLANQQLEADKTVVETSEALNSLTSNGTKNEYLIPILKSGNPLEKMNALSFSTNPDGAVEGAATGVQKNAIEYKMNEILRGNENPTTEEIENAITQFRKEARQFHIDKSQSADLVTVIAGAELNAGKAEDQLRLTLKDMNIDESGTGLFRTGGQRSQDFTTDASGNIKKGKNFEELPEPLLTNKNAETSIAGSDSYTGQDRIKLVDNLDDVEEGVSEINKETQDNAFMSKGVQKIKEQNEINLKNQGSGITGSTVQPEDGKAGDVNTKVINELKAQKPSGFVNTDNRDLKSESANFILKPRKEVTQISISVEGQGEESKPTQLPEGFLGALVNSESFPQDKDGNVIVNQNNWDGNSLSYGVVQMKKDTFEDVNRLREENNEAPLSWGEFQNNVDVQLRAADSYVRYYCVPQIKKFIGEDKWGELNSLQKAELTKVMYSGGLKPKKGGAVSVGGVREPVPGIRYTEKGQENATAFRSQVEKSGVAGVWVAKNEEGENSTSFMESVKKKAGEAYNTVSEWGSELVDYITGDGELEAKGYRGQGNQ